MLITLCFMALLVKIVDINRQNYSAVTENQSTRTLIVGTKRGDIYDRNFVSLTGSKSRLVAAVTPVVAVTEHLSKYFTSEELQEKINKGYPFLCTVNEEINNDYIRTFTVAERYTEDSLAVHISGYLGSENEGVSGIEKAYNQYLTENGGKLTVSFKVDAVGRVLAGLPKKITDDNFTSKAGVVLTLDSRIQSITEKALNNSNIESGAAMVMEIGTGELLSVASVPDFDPNNIADALGKENSPLVNKAFCAYSVGSVFKSIVAAAALEEGISADFDYECTGEITVGDTSFKCYNGKAHGETDMTSALENSCNTYFINLVMNMDKEKLLSFCRRLGFGQSDTLAPGMETASGTLPSEDNLKLKGNLANFSFGQGNFSATPLQLLKAYHVLATGKAVTTSLVKGFTNSQGLMTKAESITTEKILSDNTVEELRNMLKSVVNEGGADKAKSDLVSLSGKTGTAQSGIYENGKEICRTWFAGFFPSDNPSYVVVVMSEDGTGGNTDCAPVFKAICEGIILN